MPSPVTHRFPILVPCLDCKGRGTRPGAFIRNVVCPRCSGKSLVTLTISPDEMTMLLGGGRVEEGQGSYTIHPKGRTV